MPRPRSEFCRKCGANDWSGGKRRLCRECRRRHYQANKPALDAKNMAYSLAHKESRLLAGARSRAARRGIEFDITTEDVAAVWPADDRCPVLGLDLIWGIHGQGHVPNGASIDRIDPARGYVVGNIAVISYRANVIKHNASAKELRLVADWVDQTMANGDND